MPTRRHRTARRLALVPAVCGVLAAAPPAAAGPSPAAVAAQDPSFRVDVRSVLSKAGCNRGTCHGNKTGKGGFKLSLRGQDPAADLVALTRDWTARRTDRVEPERSLILLKATASVPHEGGQRFEHGSLPYRILRGWIAKGARDDPPDTPRPVELEVRPEARVLHAPETSARIRATARFSDGSERDVTSLAVYESSNPHVEVGAGGKARRAGGDGVVDTTVLVRYVGRQRPVRLTFVPRREELEWPRDLEPANYIDEHVFRRLRELRIPPSTLARDEVFVRRLHIDLLGAPPTAAEARSFVEDRSPGKRRRLVDELLERPEFADYWALKWADVLRNEEKVLDRKGVQAFWHWIRDSIARGKPLDRFARELIAARGSTYRNPPANWYRAQRDPLTRAESTAQVFLGLRLQCARCHNHPFDRWTQDDYYGWAALFARVRYKIVENRRRDSNDGHEFIGEQIVWTDRSGELEDPRDGRPVAPRFLGEPPLEPGEDGDRLEALAEWIASSENPQFARAQANRIWYHLMGRGLVDPIDDFRKSNPPSHPGLLDDLAQDLIDGGFDLRHLVRRVVLSKTWQLSSNPVPGNRSDDGTWYSHALVRRLEAEPLLDTLMGLTGVALEFDGYPPGLPARRIPGVRASRPRERRDTAADRFLKLFGKPPRLIPCECERSSESTMRQAFQLVSGPAVQELLTRGGGRIDRWVEALGSGRAEPREAVEELWWAALSRAPSERELETSIERLAEAGNRAERRRVLEDTVWALINSKEFLLRR